MRARATPLDAPAVDIGIAVGLFVLGSVELIGFANRTGPPALNLLAVAAGTLPLAWRRRYPVELCAWFLVVVTLQAFFLTSVDELVTMFVQLIVIAFSTGGHSPLRPALAGLGLLIVGVCSVNIGTGGAGPGDFFFPGTFVALAWLAGRALHNRALLAAELHEAAVRAEEDREHAAGRAIADERRRIAREMHDVVAHSMSVMVVQAGGARRIIDQDRERAIEAATLIERTGREALTEMRRLLGVLQPDDSAAARAPQPGLDGLERLVEGARSAGLPVDLRIEGERRPLPAGVDLAAYRIVQEGLTNAIKHAGGAPTEVRIRYGSDDILLVVSDRGPGPSFDGIAEAGGQGLLGMRERVRVVGGEVHAGARDGGGFEIRARLPLHGQEEQAGHKVEAAV